MKLCLLSNMNNEHTELSLHKYYQWTTCCRPYCEWKCHWLKALSPRRPEQWLCRAEFFPSVTNKWPFQDHFSSITLSTPRARVNTVSEFKTDYHILAQSVKIISFHCNIFIWYWSFHAHYCSHCVPNNALTHMSLYTYLTYVIKNMAAIFQIWDHSHYAKGA